MRRRSRPCAVGKHKVKQAMNHRMTKLILAMLLSLVAVTAQAAGGLPWDKLAKGEQQVLQPYAERWDSMSPEQQQRLQNGAQRWVNMNSNERQAALQRFKRWQELPEAQKQRIREHYEQFRKLSPEQQQRLRGREQQFTQLSPERQQALRQRWQAAQQSGQQAEATAEVKPSDEAAEAMVGSAPEEKAKQGEQENPPQTYRLSPQQQPARGGDFRIDRHGMDRMPRGGGR